MRGEKRMNKKILVSMMVIGLVATLAGAGLHAYFSDTEKSEGNTFTAGTLNLKVGDADPTAWKITVSNMYPGQSGSESVIVKNDGSLDGRLSISFSGLVDDENGLTEPESAEGDDTKSGELAENLHLKITIGGETVFEGYAKDILTGGYSNYPLKAGASETFTVAYSIDGTVGNIIQSDIAGFDITFSLEQATIVESNILHYGPTGWGGWSDKEASKHGWVLNCIVKGGSYAQKVRWVPGASVTVGGTTYAYPVTPFGYTYDASIPETGYIVQNDNIGKDLQLILVYPL
jgi:predicted ribosomally synthesized peptide with SipW-like signal peptide